MLTPRQLLFGLFAIAAALVNACILNASGAIQSTNLNVAGDLIAGTLLGQLGLLGIFLAWGSQNVLVRLAMVLPALWLCTHVVVGFVGNQNTRVLFWFGLVQLLTVAIPLMMARRFREDYDQPGRGPKLMLVSFLGLRRFTLAALFSVTTSVCILLALFRWLNYIPNGRDYFKIMANNLSLSAIVWLMTWSLFRWKFVWLAITISLLSAPLIGIALYSSGLYNHSDAFNIAVRYFAQAFWLLAGLLIARFTQPVEMSTVAGEGRAAAVPNVE